MSNKDEDKISNPDKNNSLNLLNLLSVINPVYL